MRDFVLIALIDLVGRRLNRQLGGLFLLNEKRLEILAQFVEQSDVVGELVENSMNEALDLAIQRVVLTHRRRPADARTRQRVDELPRRVRLLRKERSIQHRRLEHRDLQASDQGLDAVRQVPGFENEIEQHRHQLDGHRFELVCFRAQGRILQVAQDVVHVLLQTGDMQWSAGEIEARFAVLQSRKRVTQLRGYQDALAAERAEHRPSFAAHHRIGTREIHRTRSLRGRRSGAERRHLDPAGGEPRRHLRARLARSCS